MFKKTHFQIIFCLTIMVVTLIMYFYNHKDTLALEKELIRLDKKLYLEQVTFEKRQKEYDQRMEQKFAQYDSIKMEIE